MYGKYGAGDFDADGGAGNVFGGLAFGRATPTTVVPAQAGTHNHRQWFDADWD